MSATPADDVDRIVQAWHRELPDRDFAPLHVLSRVSRLARHLDRARGSAFAPGNNRSCPSVTTVSPAFTPDASNVLSASVRATFTFRSSTVESAFNT